MEEELNDSIEEIDGDKNVTENAMKKYVYVDSLGTKVLNASAGISIIALLGVFIWDKKRKVQE